MIYVCWCGVLESASGLFLLVLSLSLFNQTFFSLVESISNAKITSKIDLSILTIEMFHQLGNCPTLCVIQGHLKLILHHHSTNSIVNAQHLQHRQIHLLQPNRQLNQQQSLFNWKTRTNKIHQLVFVIIELDEFATQWILMELLTYNTVFGQLKANSKYQSG